MGALKVINQSKCNAACREAAVELERAKANIEYFDRHRETLLQRHPDQWVAIAGGKLAGHNRELTRLIESLQRRGIDPRTSLVQFMSRQKLRLSFAVPLRSLRLCG